VSAATWRDLVQATTPTAPREGRGGRPGEVNFDAHVHSIPSYVPAVPR